MGWLRPPWPPLVALAIGCVAIDARAADPEPLRLDARVRGHDGDHTTVAILPDGTTRIAQTSVHSKEPTLVLAFVLTEAEMAEVRERALASRFFDDWGPPRRVTHAQAWDVALELGARSRRRQSFSAQPEFEPLGLHLSRFVDQASLTSALRRGDYGRVMGALAPSFDRPPLRPTALVPEMVACAAAQETPERCATAAGLLLSPRVVAVWPESARTLLGRVSGDARGLVLAAWVEVLRGEGREEERKAFGPIALAEVEASWARWASLSGKERRGLAASLALLLADGVPEAFAIAERMAGSLSTVERSFRPAGLLETGAAAVPVVLRLLAAERIEARMCGADLARSLAAVLHRREGLSYPLSDVARSALGERLRGEIVPALERCAAVEGEAFSVRQACVDALDAWDGRAKAADAAAREAEDAERIRKETERKRTAPPPLLEGTSTISGRVLGPSDMPLPGFGVFVARDDGRCMQVGTTLADGSFRLEGLAEGTYRIVVSAPGENAYRRGRGASPDVDGVAAGATDVVVRLPGSFLRGRVLESSGAPAKGRGVSAQMRDAPNVVGATVGSGYATTDAEGRFWFARLMPGVYDLEVPGTLALRGGQGLVPGSEECTIELLDGGTILGRVVDETGAPFPEADVSVTPPNEPWRRLTGARVEKDGTFRVERLDPARAYRVHATFLGGEQRNAEPVDASVGATNVLLRIDTTPRLRLRVALVGREARKPVEIRIERIAGGPSTTRTFPGDAVDWRAALPGTWKVEAHVRDIDVRGAGTLTWVAVGTIEPGGPETRFQVPR